MFKSLIFFTFLSFNAFHAQAATSCDESRQRMDNVKVHTLGNSKGGCFMSVSPMNIKNLTYRDFLFDDNGLLMVFASFGEGSESETTGAREFYLFPRKNALPVARFDQTTDSLFVTHPSGTEFIFSSKTGDIASMNPGTLTVSSYFDPSENGGVEILKFQGILLDLGFRLGGAPSSIPRGLATFKDTQGNTCKVRNSEIFDIAPDGDADFKFEQDAALFKFLAQRCPQLK